MRGRKLSPAKIEQIKAVYAETGSKAEAARQCGVSRAAVSNYANASDEFDEVRQEKRLDIIDQIAEVRALYIAHMARPEIVRATTSKDAAVIAGILTDKHQLLSGEATERHEHIDNPADRITRRVDELAARRGAKRMAG